MIKTPLRYPGGKAKAVKKLKEFTEIQFNEYREPFIGGGSLFIYLKQIHPGKKFWINDLNPDVYSFWKSCQDNIDAVLAGIKDFKSSYQDGKKLFKDLINIDASALDTTERAVRFFVLNRISFSGTTESGGYSSSAFNTRFTDSSIDRVEKLATLLDDNVKITNLDYSEVLNSETEDAKNILVYLDPPYYIASKSKLYGKNGNLHLSFDHERFCRDILKSQLNWFISYDNSEYIRENFKSAKLHSWQFQYGMNNYQKDHCEIGKELIISNY
ncbi:MAG: DNA adenine methylase [Candidatus Caenarcaniphilales bacterium]|nr:DNA adenine methylase [Candidatus Caenarcaniphilales bacterium]